MTPAHTLHIYRSHGQWRWRVTHRNGRKLAHGGESYQRISALFRAVSGLFAEWSEIYDQIRAIEEAWRLSRAKGK